MQKVKKMEWRGGGGMERETPFLTRTRGEKGKKEDCTTKSFFGRGLKKKEGLKPHITRGEGRTYS